MTFKEMCAFVFYSNSCSRLAELNVSTKSKKEQTTLYIYSSHSCWICLWLIQTLFIRYICAVICVTVYSEKDILLYFFNFTYLLRVNLWPQEQNNEWWIDNQLMIADVYWLTRKQRAINQWMSWLEYAENPCIRGACPRGLPT